MSHGPHRRRRVRLDDGARRVADIRGEWIAVQTNDDMKVGFIGFETWRRPWPQGLPHRGFAARADRRMRRDRAKLHRNTEPHGFRLSTMPRSRGFAGRGGRGGETGTRSKPCWPPVKGMLAGKVVVSVAAGMTFDRYEEISRAGRITSARFPIRHARLRGYRRLRTPPFAVRGRVAVGAGVAVARGACGDGGYRPVFGIAGTVCGCGPAFVAMFIEALADAAVKHGIVRADAHPWPARWSSVRESCNSATGQHPAVMKDASVRPAVRPSSVWRSWSASVSGEP